MGDKILVGADKVRAVAMQLEHLKSEAEGAMHNYLGHTQDANAPGIWQGLAAMANVNASQEINDSTMQADHHVGRADPGAAASRRTPSKTRKSSRALPSPVSPPVDVT